MIDRHRARKIAERKIAQFQKESNVEFALVEADTFEFENGWIFYWDSKAFLQSGDFADAIAGNAPLVVLRDGSVQQAPTAFGTPEQILGWLGHRVKNTS